MDKRITLIFLALICTLLIAPGEAKTWYVDDSGGVDYTDIQAAVNNASFGDTIFVYNGTYDGFKINIPYLSIIGESADLVTVSSSIYLPEGTDTSQNATGTTLNGLKITAATKIKPSTQYGTVSDLIIRNCAFEGITSSNAIEVRAYNTTFENNVVSNCSGSNVLVLVGTANGNSTIITNNTFKNNSNAAAIAFSKTANNTVKNNRIEANNIVFLFSGVGGGNKIYLNSLFTNSQITKVSGTVSSISWSSPNQITYAYNGTTYTSYMGNNWSDYNGTDTNSDGVGDTPYVLPSTLGADNYPLMQPFENYSIGSSVPVAPIAAFTASPTSGDAPLTVSFTDQSTGSPTSWQWDFNNDGTVDSTEQNPIYTFSTAGTYSVNLTVSNAEGSDSEVKTGYITVNEPVPAPVANFTASPTSGNAPLTVQFTDASTGTVSSYAWDFNNDGIVDSNTQSPSYTYSEPGTYTVNLTVTGPDGSDSEVKTNYITATGEATHDLTISGLVNTVPASAVFARETNAVTLASIKNTGPALTNVSVALYASDVSGGPVNTTTIASIGLNEMISTTSIVDPTIRSLEGGTVTYTAVVDPENLIPETNEANNNKSSASKPVKYNGYKGKGIYWEGGSNITTKHTYDLQGNLLYSTQPDTAYKAVGWSDRTETWTADDLPIPSGSAIEKVLLYFAYNWDQTPGGYPWLNLNFNGNTIENGNLSTGNGILYRDW
ncbi:PKD domain-containing protein, partial [Methanosarcina sp.]